MKYYTKKVFEKVFANNKFTDHKPETFSKVNMYSI